MLVLRIADHALLAEVPDAAAAAALCLAARADEVDAVDVVPAARSVLFDGVADPAALAGWLRAWPGPQPGSGRPQPAGHLVEVPVRYDGPDLADVAERWQMSFSEAVATHAGTQFLVAFCGFAPGFPYCVGLPADLHVPRLGSPRPRVPAGSVGVAGEFTGIYPSDSPGGWRLLGRTDLRLWDVAEAEPAKLPPGTRVRFVPT